MTLYEIDFSKKIRLSTWNLIYFILYSHANNRFHDTDNKEFFITPDLVKRQDWEYYQEIEQKKKVKKWLWRYKDTSCWLVDYQYMDDVQMVSKGRVTDRNYEKLLWSEIEVEE